jgi:hypothetical protein
MLWVRLSPEVSCRDRPFRAWPVGTHYEQNADGVELWTPGNRTFPSSRSPCPKYPCHGLSDKMKITPDCLSIGTMYFAKGLLLTGVEPASEFPDIC